MKKRCHRKTVMTYGGEIDFQHGKRNDNQPLPTTSRLGFFAFVNKFLRVTGHLLSLYSTIDTNIWVSGSFHEFEAFGGLSSDETLLTTSLVTNFHSSELYTADNPSDSSLQTANLTMSSSENKTTGLIVEQTFLISQRRPCRHSQQQTSNTDSPLQKWGDVMYWHRNLLASRDIDPIKAVQWNSRNIRYFPGTSGFRPKVDDLKWRTISWSWWMTHSEDSSQ